MLKFDVKTVMSPVIIFYPKLIFKLININLRKQEFTEKGKYFKINGQHS